MPLPADLIGRSHTARAFAKNFLEVAFYKALESSQLGTELEILEWLLRSGISLDTVLQSPDRMENCWRAPTLLQCAIIKGSVSVARQLIQLGADVNLSTGSETPTPLFLAVERAAISAKDVIVALLLNAGAGRKPEKLSAPLSLAITEGPASIVQLLLQHGADVDFRLKSNDLMISWQTALSSAASTNLNFFKAILSLLPPQTQHRISSERSSITSDVFYMAIWGGKADIVGYLSDLGVDLRSPNSEGITPIQLAVLSTSSDKVSLCRFLLQNGACLGERVEGSPSALQLAAMRGDVGLMKFFLQQGASTDDCCILKENQGLLLIVPPYEILGRNVWHDDDVLLLDTICGLSSPDLPSIVAECSNFYRRRENWDARASGHYDQCGELLKEHLYRGTRFFTQDDPWEMVQDALANGVHPGDMTIER